MSSEINVSGFLCIHGHFYQPPREDPLSDMIKEQESAAPFHDWNERITHECYAPNAHLPDARAFTEFSNNYSRISFNFGPTLLRWIQATHPEIYAAILQADKDSQEHFCGHGSAIAQAYHHSILPLANLRDKETEVIWGIRDFEYRFGRTPVGMWLAETATDIETLEVLSSYGIRFTILSPLQATSVRAINGDQWFDVEDGSIDPGQPYQVILPSGREITLFFYDKALSKAVSFEKLLRSGETFSNRLKNSFREGTADKLVHIASDGEVYGHHNRNGEVALRHVLKEFVSDPDIELTVYSRYLETHPHEWVVRIKEPSSWSCPHGVARWTANCGCQTGGQPGWTQEWREPLREALDWLRNWINPRFVSALSEYLKDPWEARNSYVSLLLDKSDHAKDTFFAEHSVRTLSAEERTRALKLLEMQRFALMMYTSCGWFFNDLSGIETIQILRYAGRVLDLARNLFSEDASDPFLKLLERAKSNDPGEGTGRDIFRKHCHEQVKR